MGFSDNIFLITGGICPPSYRVSILGSAGVYVEGVLKILDINSDFILLRVKDCKLKFFGEGLKINSYFDRDISILGNVVKIEKIREK